jgi:hypothetical protein
MVGHCLLIGTGVCDPRRAVPGGRPNAEPGGAAPAAPQRGGGLVFGPPKSEAGRRTVAIPELITPEPAVHLVTYARPGDDGLVFTSAQGALLRHSNFAAGPSGQHSRRSGFVRCISTICAIPEISLPPMPVLVCGS